MTVRKIRETRAGGGWVSEIRSEARSAARAVKSKALGVVYDRIDKYRPIGLSAHGVIGQLNDGNDAWRHMMLSGLLTLKLSPSIARQIMTTYEQLWGEDGSIESEMDYKNNDVGIELGERYRKYGDRAEALMALGVISGIASGEAHVQDRQTKKLRESNYQDIPRGREPFKPERDHNDFRGGAEGLDA